MGKISVTAIVHLWIWCLIRAGQGSGKHPEDLGKKEVEAGVSGAQLEFSTPGVQGENRIGKP